MIVLYELIINFPVKNKICNWIKNHKYLLLLFFLFIDSAFNGLMVINPLSVNNKIIENGRNYQICEMTSYFGNAMFNSLKLDKFVIFIVISFLIFIEWNTEKIYYEVRFIFLALYSNCLLVFVALLFDYVHINYFMEFIIQECLVIFMSITNYIFLYGYRIFLAYLYKKNMRLNSMIIKSDFFKTQTKNEFYINNSSILGSNINSYIESYNNNNINTEQMIVSSPPRFFTKMYNHYLKESSDNLNRSF